MATEPPSGHKIVHLELNTPNLGRACSFYGGLLGWRPERVDAGGLSYLALELGTDLGGGVVEEERDGALWLPYVEVDDVAGTTEEAVARGAIPVLDVREGPGGWRSVVRAPDGAEIAFWQRKR